jgi:CRISPR-associated protein Csd2
MKKQTTLQNKIDFAVIFSVKNANPNGDPLNGNRPRTDYSGNGEVTDVCIKRKLRDRLLEAGAGIFVQADDRKVDDEVSLRNRFENTLGQSKPKKGVSKEEILKLACEKWLDVRAFGQLFAFGKDDDAGGVSFGMRGPVTIQSAFSKEPVSITSTQITKSVNSSGDGSKRTSDTMGMKHRVDYGVYETYGSMNPQPAERSGFSDADADLIKAQLPRLFENDASSSRPEGSMRVLKVVWWKHASKLGQYSSARVHDALRSLLQADGSFDVKALRKALPGLEPEIIEGF